MIDIKIIREKPEIVKENIKRKFQNDKIKLVDEVAEKDSEWRALKSESDELRGSRNKISKEISEIKKSGGNADELLKKAKEIPGKINEVESRLNYLESQIKKLLLQIPNIVSKKAPVGKDEGSNRVVKKWGSSKKLSWAKNHVELLESLGLADFDASARVSGNGFYYLKGELAYLNQALIRFGIDFMNKKGYNYIETPLMLNENAIYASMSKAEIQNSVYSIKGEDLNLIGTAEQSLLAMHAGDVIREQDLPKKYYSYSMCFRKEIGSHGINEKGLWRTHQFNKVEQFIFCKPEDSEKLYDELLENSEGILKALKLPYRVVEFSSGGLADWKHRSADLEVYRPTTGEYGEVMSLSNCTDYQARKLGIKVVDSKGNRSVLHTLNDTALASSRILVVILENNQQKDGSVKVPGVLQKYMGGLKKIAGHVGDKRKKGVGERSIKSFEKKIGKRASNNR
jgi:seryl-tRNA synthetase